MYTKTGNRQQATGNRQQATGNRQQATVVSKFCSFLYNCIVIDLQKSKTIRFKWKVLNTILRFIDPEVSVYIGQKKLRMNLSQKTPFFYANFKSYDRALPRISEKVQKIDGYLTFIDIGANIGDTVSLVSEKINGAEILCIEGNERFLHFLNINIQKIENNNVYVEPNFCVDTLEKHQFEVNTKNGTAYLSFSNNKLLENTDTLDNMLNKNKIFSETNILKIDTDGFEITVLNGGRKLLESKHPMIFFEFTPEAYIGNKQNPMDLINYLNSVGYTKSLFYDNFGNPIGIYAFTDSAKIQNLIAQIDNNKIYYYDILCIHEKDENKYHSILEDELHGY